MRAKRQKTAGVFRIILLAAAIAAAGPAAAAQAAGGLNVARMTQRTDIPGLSYSCVYPRVSGIVSRDGQDRLNVMLRETALSALKAAELEAKKSPGAGVSGGFDFSVERSGAGMLSLRLVSTLRGPAPGTEITGLCADTVTGKVYRLGDIFRDDADYIGMLSEQAAAANGRAPGKDGGRVSISPCDSFYLTRDSLVVIPQAGRGADGAPREITVRLRSLEGSLKPSLRLCE
jgi:hypothetical protein